jgi:hypothetical protein
LRRFSWAFTPNGGEYVGKVLYLKKETKKVISKSDLQRNPNFNRYFGSWFVVF